MTNIKASEVAPQSLKAFETYLDSRGPEELRDGLHAAWRMLSRGEDVTISEEIYNGWTNRETWAVALHINNDEGWQESVHEALRAMVADHPDPDFDETLPYRAGEVIHENVERVLSGEDYGVEQGNSNPSEALRFVQRILPVINDIGSLWRVSWTELGASFLSDLEEG